MNYQEFREEIITALLEQMPEGTSAKLVEVQKLNGCIRYGITFWQENLQACPTIYLEPFYASFQKGEQIENLVKEILDCFLEEIQQVEEITGGVDRIWDYEKAKTDIYCKLIHCEKNEQLLKDVPYIPFLDFAIVAYFEVVRSDAYKGSILVRNAFLDAWNITAEQMLQNALERTRLQKTLLLMPMSELAEAFGLSESEYDLEAEKQIYVLTSQEKQHGTIFVYYPEVLEYAANKIQENFYLLPASIHEWILVPVSVCNNRSYLQNMVKEVNRTEVLDEEILSDHVYYYAQERKELTIVLHIQQ